VVCAGHLSERIVEYFGDGGRFGVNIKYSVESNGLLGTAGALKNAERLLEDKFFVMYGDSYLRLDYGEIESYFGTVKEPVLMVVYKNGNRLDRSNVLLSGGFVAKYDKNAPEGLEYIDYGLSIFRKDAISGLPAGRAVSLEEVFARLAREGSIRAYIAKESFFEIGSIEGLERFRKYIKGL
jgi:N-acetyl-alpha-D-muramate 1-phosphate uridylyltransferase